MNARTLLLPLLLASLPAMAGFKQPSQYIRLAQGQNAVTVTFQTEDGTRVTSARPLCDCTTVQLKGDRLVAQVDTTAFDAKVDKQIEATTSDGQKTTLTMLFEVPQAVEVSPTALIWQRGSAPTPQMFRLRIPKGSPVRALKAADLNGKDFDYRAQTVVPGQEYTITVTPLSTARATLNRLLIRMDSTDPRFTRKVLYLRVR